MCVSWPWPKAISHRWRSQCTIAEICVWAIIYYCHIGCGKYFIQLLSMTLTQGNFSHVEVTEHTQAKSCLGHNTPFCQIGSSKYFIQSKGVRWHWLRVISPSSRSHCTYSLNLWSGPNSLTVMLNLDNILQNCCHDPRVYYDLDLRLKTPRSRSQCTNSKKICIQIITPLTAKLVLNDISHSGIHVKSPSLGGRLPLFDPISLLNIHLPPKSGNLPLFEPHFLPIIFSFKRVNFLEFNLQWKCIAKSAKYPLCIIWWVFSHYKEKISRHFQNFSWNLNVDGQN